MTDISKHPDGSRNGIGTLNEKSLHAQIIEYLSEPGDILESEIDGYWIDIHRGDKIIEVQTRSLQKLLKKVSTLAKKHTVEIVYPIYKTKFIHRVDKDGNTISRRKSPKTGKLVHAFEELLYTPDLISDPNVSLTLMMIEADEIWRDDGQGSWRRKHWSIADRQLIEVISQHHFHKPDDLLSLLPRSLPAPFTNRQLVENLKVSARLAGKITYTLRKMGLIQIAGKQGRAYLFETI